ncbi:phosphotransferase [Deinococcus marmoris]
MGRVTPIDLALLIQKIRPAAQLLRSRTLAGGVSARVTALEIRKVDGQIEVLVVREYGPRDLQTHPDVARQEFNLLRALYAAGLPVPQPHHVEAGVLIIDFMDGQPEFEPADGTACVRQMAAFLARLHALPPAAFAFLRPLATPSPRPENPDDSLSEGRIRDALDRLETPPLTLPAVLHGDFWSGNILWSGGCLNALIDWEDAALGDPLADVGNARLELLFFLGREAMRAFTDEYAVLSGVEMTPLPYWDLRAALRPCGRLSEWGLEQELERQVRERHREFVASALEQLQLP